jgi:hypothetical protein
LGSEGRLKRAALLGDVQQADVVGAREIRNLDLLLGKEVTPPLALSEGDS